METKNTVNRTEEAIKEAILNIRDFLLPIYEKEVKAGVLERIEIETKCDVTDHTLHIYPVSCDYKKEHFSHMEQIFGIRITPSFYDDSEVIVRISIYKFIYHEMIMTMDSPMTLDVEKIKRTITGILEKINNLISK